MSQFSSQPAHIAVIDTSINDYQTLVDAARSKGQNIILVSNQTSGLAQVVEGLAGYSDVASLSIFSHGSAGAFELGGDRITASNVSMFEELLAGIGGSLSEGAEILLYGCDVAQGQEGEAFVKELSRMTGVEVAASDDPTGASELGGDWSLEFATSSSVMGSTMQPLPGFAQILSSHPADEDFEDETNDSAVVPVGASGRTIDDLVFFSNNANANSAIGTDSSISTLRFPDGSRYFTLPNAEAGTTEMGFESANNSEFKLVSLSISNVDGRTNGAARTENFQVKGYDALGNEVASDTLNTKSGDSSGSITYTKIAYSPAPTLQRGTLTFDTSWGSVQKIVFTGTDSGVGTTNTPSLAFDNIDMEAAVSSNNDPVFSDFGPYSVAEDATNGTAVGDVNANDGDGGADDANVTYSIIGGNPNIDSDGNAGFSIDSKTGSVTVNDADDIDYETSTSHSLTVRAEDAGGATKDQTVTINVTDALDTNNALYFDSDASVTGLNGIGQSPANFTIEFNLYLDVGISDWAGIYWSSTDDEAGVYLNSNRQIEIWNDQSFFIRAVPALDLESWTHVAITYSGPGTLKVYLDGVEAQLYLDESNSDESVYLPTNGVQMGGSSYNLGNSALDDFRVWNETRTSTQINDNKGAELTAPFSSSLQRYYDFNHGTGGENNAGETTLVERTGNGNDGTLNNFSLSGDTSNFVEKSSLQASTNVPSLTATGADPTFTENGSAVTLFSAADANTNDTDQTITGITLTVTNVSNGAAESLTIGGTTVSLTNSSSGAIGSGGNFSVSVTGVTATVTLTNLARTEAQMDTLLQGITYINTSDAPGTDARVITVTQVTDSGGSNNSASVSQASTVSITAVNDVPTATNLTKTVQYNDSDNSVALDDIVVTDPDAGDTITATLTLSATGAGSLSTGAFGSSKSTYDSGTGVWTVSGTVTDVNAALADVAFTPTSSWNQDSSITTQIRDGSDTGPANGLITLDVTDTTAPTVTLLGLQSPGSNITNSDTLVWRVDFSESVKGIDATDFTVSGTTATVTNVTDQGNNTYYVTASGGDLASYDGAVALSFSGGQNIEDANGNALTNTTPTGTNNNSYTLDNTAPTFDGFHSSPADNGFLADLTSDITLRFSENIDWGNGNITLWNITDSDNHTIVESFDVADAEGGISGQNWKLEPAQDLSAGSSYSIRIDSTAVEDMAGNTFAGISDDTTYNFSTAPYVELSVDSSSVAEDGGVATVTATLKDALGNTVQATDTVTLDLSTSSDSAVWGDDYSLNTKLSITAGQSSASTKLTSTGDSLPEGNETATISIASVNNAIEDGDQEVTVTLVENEAPDVDLNGSAGEGGNTSFSYSEGDSATVVAPSATLTDSNNDDITSMTVTLTARPDGDATETLALSTLAATAADNEGLSVNYTESTGVLLVSGQASASVYQSVLRGVTYVNTSQNPTESDREVTVVANDGTANSQSSKVTISVTAENDAPVLDDSKELSLTQIAEDLSSPDKDSTNNSTLVSELTTGVTDVDGDNDLGIAITAANSTEGTLWYSLDDGKQWSQVGTVSESQALWLDADDRLYWQPNANTHGKVEEVLTFRATDTLLGGERGSVSNNGGSSHYSSATDTVSVTVESVNDAPTVTAHANYSMSGTNEDTTSGETTVSTLLTGVGYSDADSGDESGIAVTSLSGNGTWQYDAQDDDNWTDMPSVSQSDALLLSAATKLRYIPDGENGEKPSIEFRAWDQDSGTASTNGNAQTADVSTSGGSTAFSVNSASGSFIVSAVNDAPVLDDTEKPTLLSVDEDLAGPTDGSTSNSTLISALTAGVSDVDTNANKGIAITSIDDTSGTLHYSTDDGVTWNTVSGVSNDNALLLSAGDRLYWQPDAQVNGKVDSVITFRAWDQSSGVAGNFADTSSSGDTTAFSTATDTIAVTVNAINDAPTLSSASYNMTATNEDTAQTVNVSDLLTTLGYADVEQASGGVAVVENSGSGDWEYSTDSGTSWHDLGSAEVTSAVLLNNTAQLRYTPVGDNAESDVALKVRAWDGDEGSASSGATRNTADTTLTGGDTAFSSQQASVTLDVTALNDAPTLSAGSNLLMTSIDEDSTSATLTVSQLLTNAGYADVDSGAAQGLALVTASGSGQWQYSSDNKTWNTVDSVSNANALLLDADTVLRYVGDGIKGGAAILGFHAWDTTTGSHASTVDLSEGSSKGGTSAFSSDSGVATLIVSSVNDAPVLDNTKELSLTPIAEDLAAPSKLSSANSTLVSELTTGVTDVDGDTDLGIAITATNSSKGTLWYSLNDGDSWSEVGTVSDTSALLLDAKHRLYWQPAENENGTVSDAFTFRAIDSLLGGESGNVSTNGGTTHYSTATDTVSVTVNAVNDAPTVTANANHSMSATDEDTTSGETTVSALLAGVGYSDADASAQSGIAVTSLSGNGTWQYDAQNDGNWAAMPSVAESGALLLSAATKLRYVPDGENSEKPSIEFRAWDQTSGAASTNGSPQTVDVSTHGAATAFSANTASGSFIVSAVNDAPVLDNTKVLSLTTINEDLVAPTGTGDLVNAMEVVNLASGISDVDTGASKGIAITAVNNTDGKLFYSLDGGSHWSEVTGVTESNALLLESSDHLYWQPSANANGTVSDAVTIRAWDDTSGEGGDFVDTSTNGGTTAFSTATDTVQVAVNPVNDAPTINAGPHALSATNEDTTSSATTVSDLMNALGYDDIDSSDWGIAITSAGGNGEWEYSTDSGTTWHSVGSVSATSSLLLLAAHQVRYQPDEANAESSVTLNVRGWDGTSGAASSGATRGTADTSTNGGSTAFSSQQGSVTINVSAVNDAPTINASTEYTMASVNEDASSTATVAVSAILANAGLADVDTGALSGLVITGESARGDWEYSLDSGKTWSAVSDVSTSAALALSSTDLLRYAPDAERGEEATLTYQAWDQTTGNAGDTLDVSTNGGTTAYSQQSGTVSVDITDVNDDPTGTVTIAGQPYTGTTLTAEHDVADVDGVDLDGFKYVWRADGVVIANETESTLVLGASQLNKKITVTVEYTDLNKTSESVSSDPTAVIQLPPEPPADTSNDGATVNKSTETRDDGTTVDVTDIEIVTEDREEETGDENEANVPVVTEDDERLLEVGLPTGSGMRVESEGTGTGANGLIQAIRARTNGDGQQQDQQELTGSGNSFLDDLPDPDTLVVRTLVPKVANNTPTAPIKVSGTPAGSKPVAVVIDTTELPSGQMLILDSVQFGAIIGEVIIIGGTGQNSVTGDGRVQIMVLGEDDDVLRGGGGDDLVGSRGGDDMLYGDAGNDKVIGGAGNDTLEGGSGNDILQGGASDAGEWTFSLKDNQLVSRFAASDVVATDTETFELVGPWFTEGSSGLETDTRLQFSYADNARLELVATLYKAAVGEKASLMDFNTFVNSDLSSKALANEAVNFYFNSQGLVGQALEVQVTMLIEAVWGEGSASDALIAEGVNFLSNGGSWADAMLILAQAEQAEQLLENEDGELVLVQTYQTSETGWSSATGDDILRGGTGNDRLVGGDGNDLLDGGEGTDVAVFTGGAGDFTFQVVFSDAAEVGAQPAQLLLTRTVNGETDTLQGIELLKIGGHYFELNADLSGYAEGTDYALVEIIGQLSVEEVNAIGLAGVY